MYDTLPQRQPAIWDRASASDVAEGSNSPSVVLGILPGFFVVLAVCVTSWYMFLSRDAVDPTVMMALEAERMAAIATAAGPAWKIAADPAWKIAADPAWKIAADPAWKTAAGSAWISLPDPAPSPCGQSAANEKNGLPG